MKKIAILLIIIGLVGILFTAKGYFNREEIAGEASFSAEEIERITIVSDVANIQVLPTTEEKIKVVWEDVLIGSKKKEDLIDFHEDGSELKINIGEKKGFGIRLWGFNFLQNRNIKIYLPEKEYKMLQIKNDVGKTTVSSVTVNQLIAKTNVSSIKIKDVITTELDAKSDVGTLKLENVVGELRVRSNVGNISIHLEEVNDAIEAESDVGNIKVYVTEIPTNVSFVGISDLGSVKMFGDKGNYIQENADHIVSLETDVGNIKVQLK